MTARPLQVGDIVADVAAGFTGGFCLAVGLERHSPALLAVAAVWALLAVADVVRLHRAAGKRSGEPTVTFPEPGRVEVDYGNGYSVSRYTSSSVSLLGGDGSGATSPRAGSAGPHRSSHSGVTPQTTNKAQQ